MVVTNHDNISNDFYFSDVIKIAFNEEGTSITTPNASTASISPNPVKDNLMIQDAEKMYGSDICIYSVTGTLVSKYSQWNGESINVSHLSPGIYFVNTNSTTLKFVKK